MSAAAGIRVCTFRIGELVCAVPAEQVREVARVGLLTPVPGAAAHVAGVLNVRGQVLCAVECASRLGQRSDGRFSLMVTHHGRVVAVLADAIIDIGALAGELQPAPVTAGAQVRSLVAGVFDIPDGVVHLLDLDEVIGR